MNKVTGQSNSKRSAAVQEDAFQITLGPAGKFFAGTHPKSERCSTAMRFWLHCSHLLLKDLLGRA